MKRSGYDIEDFDDAIFSGEVRKALARQRCQADGEELRWTVPQKTIQMGQTVTITGTCVKCGRQYEMEFRL